MPSDVQRYHRMRARRIALQRWSRLVRDEDRTAATQAARDARWRGYLDRARELAPDASEPEVERSARQMYRADMLAAAEKSWTRRRRKARRTAAGADR